MIIEIEDEVFDILHDRGQTLEIRPSYGSYHTVIVRRYEKWVSLFVSRLAVERSVNPVTIWRDHILQASSMLEQAE